MDHLTLIAAAVALVLLNGFFVAAEFAIVKLRTTQAEELARERGWLGRILLNVRLHLDAYLSACQLGITLASVALGWIGEPAFASLMEPVLRAGGIDSQEVIHSISFAVAFGIISFMHIVLGELAPKSIAIRNVEDVSLWTAAPLFFFYWLMYPFIRVLNGSANLLLRAVKVELVHDGDDPLSPDEIRKVLIASHRHGELKTSEARLLSQAMELSDLTIGDLMRPVSDLVYLDLNRPVRDHLQTIAQHRYSRYPACEGGPDHVIGVLHVKDLLAALVEDPACADLRPLLREAPIVQRHMAAYRMFRRFKRGISQLALVVDELETVVGFLTLDHIREAVLGRAQDEFRRSGAHWRQVEGGYEGRGTMSLLSLERLAGVVLPDTEVDSVGGLVMQALDRVPRTGDRVDFDGFSVEVLKMRGPKIDRLVVKPSVPAAVAEDG